MLEQKQVLLEDNHATAVRWVLTSSQNILFKHCYKQQITSAGPSRKDKMK